MQLRSIPSEMSKQTLLPLLQMAKRAVFQPMMQQQQPTAFAGDIAVGAAKAVAVVAPVPGVAAGSWQLVLLHLSSVSKVSGHQNNARHYLAQNECY